MSRYEAKWVHGRWWRVMFTPDGASSESVWCETSDEQEARESLASCPGGGRLERLWVFEAACWRPDGDQALVEHEDPDIESEMMAQRVGHVISLAQTAGARLPVEYGRAVVESRRIGIVRLG